MRRDSHYIQDIEASARLIGTFTTGMTFAEFDDDERTRSAVERQMIIMGEAANRVSQHVKDKHPDFPWSRLVQLRNFYTHGYDRLEPEQVWGTVKRLAPRIARMAARIAAEEREDEE